MPFFFKYLIYKNRHDLGKNVSINGQTAENEEFAAKLGTLVDGLKLTDYHPLGIYWNVLKLDRFMVVAYILYYLSDETFIQLMSFMGIQVLSAAYIIICKPM